MESGVQYLLVLANCSSFSLESLTTLHYTTLHYTTLHYTTHYTLHTTHYTLHTTHYTPHTRLQLYLNSILKNNKNELTIVI